MFNSNFIPILAVVSVILISCNTKKDTNGVKLSLTLYDSTGNISEQERIMALGIKSKSDWSYKDDKDTNGVKFSLTLYDTTGNIIEQFHYSSNDEYNRKVSYQYDEFGKATKKIEYDNNGIVTHQTVYKYDDKGKVIEEIHYDENLNVKGKTRNKYDERGYLIEQRSRLRMRIYPRDAYGRETDEAMELVFNTNGVTIAMTIKYHKHDKWGNRVEGLIFNGDGRNRGIESIDSRLVYEYDENGNLISESRIISPTGKFWYMRKYTYEYYKASKQSIAQE